LLRTRGTECRSLNHRGMFEYWNDGTVACLVGGDFAYAAVLCIAFRLTSVQRTHVRGVLALKEIAKSDRVSLCRIEQAVAGYFALGAGKSFTPGLSTVAAGVNRRLGHAAPCSAAGHGTPRHLAWLPAHRLHMKSGHTADQCATLTWRMASGAPAAM
jgi:uncharacterized protein (DUF2062 family)